MSNYMKQDAKIFIAGHRWLVGSAIHRELSRLGYTNILTRGRAQLDLLSSNAVNDLFEKEKPEHVVLAAAKGAAGRDDVGISVERALAVKASVHDVTDVGVNGHGLIQVGISS